MVDFHRTLIEKLRISGQKPPGGDKEDLCREALRAGICQFSYDFIEKLVPICLAAIVGSNILTCLVA